jgi:hypothetical protein
MPVARIDSVRFKSNVSHAKVFEKSQGNAND